MEDGIGTTMRIEKSGRAWFFYIPGWVTIWLIAVTSLTSYADTSNPSIATAQVLETKIFIQDDKGSRFEHITFNVPESGEAILRVVNGAKINAEPRERLDGAEIILNGKPVVTPQSLNKKTDVLKLKVSLQLGVNRLDVKLLAKPGKRLSVRIDTNADKVVLQRVPRPFAPTFHPLQARATVTGLGLPVPNAHVRFESLDFEPMIDRWAVTGEAGIARTFITGLKSSEGKLRATLAGTELSDMIPIQVEQDPAITLKLWRPEVTARVGSSTSFGLTINVLKDVGDQLVTLEQAVVPDYETTTPDPRLVAINSTFPANGMAVKAPLNIPVIGTVTGLEPGNYRLKLTAKVVATGESADAEATISIRAPRLLVLNVPSAIPGAIKPSSEPTTVTFRTLVPRISEPPKMLYLDEVTREGKFIAERATLNDNGIGADTIEGDDFFAGTHNIVSPMENQTPVEGERYYRLRAELRGSTVFSSIVSFPITNLPLKARPSNPDLLIEDPKIPTMFFANEVIVATLVDVTPRSFKRILAEVNVILQEKRVLKESQELIPVGFIPPLNLYLIEISNNVDPEVIHHAIREFSAYEEIKDASPNFVGKLGTVGEPSEERFPGGLPTQCNPPPPSDDDASQCQYYLQSIKADDAWELLVSRGATDSFDFGSNVKIAVIDNGIDFGHADLSGQRQGGDNTGPKTHGTLLAGLVASKHDNGGIAGVAPGAKLVPFPINRIGDWSIGEAANSATLEEAKIVNFSQDGGDSTALRNAICGAICNGRLLATLAGNRNPCNQGDVYPAKYNDPGFLICNDSYTAACAGKSIDASTGLFAVGAIDLDMDGDTNIDSLYGGVIASNMNAAGTTYCSNIQTWVDMYAPGEEIITTQSNGGWAPASGTSLSTPLVAGAAAVLWAASQTDSSLVIEDIDSDGNIDNIDFENHLRTRGRPLELLPQVHPVLTPLITGNNTNDEAQIRGLVGDARVLDLLAALDKAPQITSAPITEATVGQPYVYDVEATDPDSNDVLTFSREVSPAGMTIDPNSGLIQWTPAGDQVGNHFVTIQVTDSYGTLSVIQSFTINVTLTNLDPIIELDRIETAHGSDGNPYDYYHIPVVNWQVYPPEMFVVTPVHGPCGLNPTPSRTWVEIFDAANNNRLYGFCALGTPNNLSLIWFAVPAGSTPPANVYIELHDRENNIRYRSNTLAIL